MREKFSCKNERHNKNKQMTYADEDITYTAEVVKEDYTVSTKSKPKGFYTITLKIVIKFPSNLAHSIND